ncbi:MAG TPA: hypothetical protein VLG44_05385 [Chlamydiales bacterium]|nr:hypothetical protein [Chlamydiales bacterium]
MSLITNSINLPTRSISEAHALTLDMWRESFERAQDKMRATADSTKVLFVSTRKELMLLSRKFISENDFRNDAKAREFATIIENFCPDSIAEVADSSEKESLTKEAAEDDLHALTSRIVMIFQNFETACISFTICVNTYQKHLLEASQNWKLDDELGAFQAERCAARLKEQLGITT